MEEHLRKEIMPGLMLTCIKTDKFKTGCLSVTLLTALEKSTAAMGAMLMHVLRRATARMPDMESISGALDELYGAKIEAAVRKIGEVQCIGFVADFVDDQYIPQGEKTLEKTVSILSELLLEPATSAGRLVAEYVESEKKNQIDRIRASKNDKIQYSMQRLTELMCSGERYGISRLGTESAAEAVTVGKLTKYYRKVLANSPIEVFYCGAAEPRRVERAIRESFRSLARAESVSVVPTDIKLVPDGEVRYYTESMNVGQGKLAMGFRIGETMRNLNYPALMTFNAVFGGSVTSKLFENVREKLSLCYFASSRVDIQKGIMIAISGVDFENAEKAQNEIFHQLECCARGEITQNELDAAKRAVITSLHSASDSAAVLEQFNLSQVIGGFDFTPDKLAELVEKVSIEEVVSIAAGIKPDTVYFLKGEETCEEDC